MSRNSENDSSEYQGWKEEIRSEIEANEGHATPDPHELWDRAAYDARSAADWIDDMPVSEAEIRTAKGDVLSALVALEMAEERLEGSGGTGQTPLHPPQDPETPATVWVVAANYADDPHSHIEAVYDNVEAARQHEQEIQYDIRPSSPIAWWVYEETVKEESYAE